MCPKLKKSRGRTWDGIAEISEAPMVIQSGQCNEWKNLFVPVFAHPRKRSKELASDTGEGVFRTARLGKIAGALLQPPALPVQPGGRPRRPPPRPAHRTPAPAPCPNRRPAHAVRPSPLPILPSSHAPTLSSRIRLLIQARSGAKGFFDTGAPWSKLEEYLCSWPRRMRCFHSPLSSSIVVACGMVGCWTAAKQPSQRKKLNDAFLVCFSQAANLVRTPSRLTSQLARFGFVCMAGMACENLDVKGNTNLNPIRNLDLAGRIR